MRKKDHFHIFDCSIAHLLGKLGTPLVHLTFSHSEWSTYAPYPGPVRTSLGDFRSTPPNAVSGILVLEASDDYILCIFLT